MPPSRVCPECDAVVLIRLKVCKSCQHVFRAKRKTEHTLPGRAMKRLRVVLSDSVKSVVKAKDKLYQACKRAAESSEQTLHRQQHDREHKASVRTAEFEVPDIKTAGSFTIELKGVHTIPEHTRVTVQAKVLKIHQSQRVGGKRVKQDITIANKTGRATLTLWDKDVGVMEANTSYQFNRLETRSFMGKQYLSFPSTVSSFDRIVDLPEVPDFNADSCSSDEEEDLISASIIGIKDLETHYTCVNCNKPAVTPTDEHTGVCDHCKIMQKLTSKQSAKLIKSGATKITLKAFEEAIQEIVQSKPNATEVSPQELLFSPAFNCSYN